MGDLAPLQLPIDLSDYNRGQFRIYKVAAIWLRRPATINQKIIAE